MVSEVAQRYAQGLFDLAREENDIPSKSHQASLLLETIENDATLMLFLQAVKIDDDTKKTTIDSVFQDIFDRDMLHFLKLLIDKDRTYYLKEILQEIVKLCDEAMGIVKAEVYSARKLSDTDMAKLQDAISHQTNKQTRLINIVDDSLIAGIKVKVGNTVTDVTMKSKLEQMKEVLMKGGLA